MSKTNDLILDLILPLKKQWYNMIDTGEKPEEYREITPYWCRRFLDVSDSRIDYLNEETIEFMVNESLLKLRQFLRVTFTLGYPKAGDTARRMTFNKPKIRIGTGRPEWGAVEGKKYFIITWDKTKKRDMRVEGLMINDWVEWMGNYCKVDLPLLMTEYQDNIDSEFVKPIPITVEILKKNGFTKIKSEENVYHRHFNKGYISVYNTLNNGFRITLLCRKSNEYEEVKCRVDFVHELQHEFKNRKLFDLANNFKV